MVAIGIDIGGTSIKGAAVDSDGKIYDTFSMPVSKWEPGEVCIRKLTILVQHYIASHRLEDKIVGIGIGSPGTLDVSTGTVNYANNLRWENVRVADLMHEILPYPIKLINDANAAALGEARFGAGKNYATMIMVTLGTGVGGAIVVDGKLLEGNESKGGELGHMTIVVDGEKCTCGRNGCLEAYASATALARETKKAMLENRDSSMWKLAPDLNFVDGTVPFGAAKQGDPAALKVIDYFVKYLGEGLLNYCNIFRPNVIVLSGGVANAGEFLLSRVNQYLRAYNYGYKFTPEVPVVPAVLGYDAGKIGAAALFF